MPELAMHERDWQFAKWHLSDPIGTDAMADAWIAANGLRVETQLDESCSIIAPIWLSRHACLMMAIWLEDCGRFLRRAGHLCFVDSVSGRMFTGDHVLDPVTPHVGIWYLERGDSLGEYIASLHKVKVFGATGVTGARRAVGLEHRVDELLAHEQTRESQVIATLEAGSRSAADVVRALPLTRRNRALDELPPTHRQFAVAESLAHLEHLRVSKRVARDEYARPITYTLRIS